MPVSQGGLPVVWDDALAPAFAQGAGAAAPATNTFVSPLRLLTFSAGDSIDTAVQLPHDLYIPASGNITLKPHVHWTFVSEPTTDQTVIWEYEYVYAKGSGSLATAGFFGASTETPLTATAYTATGDTEIRAHLITGLGDITIAVANVAPSMILIGRLILKATSTISANVVGLLSFDIHYQKGPIGTVGEYS